MSDQLAVAMLTDATTDASSTSPSTEIAATAATSMNDTIGSSVVAQSSSSATSTASSSTSTTEPNTSRKRKLDKQTRRAAWKMEKKARQAKEDEAATPIAASALSSHHKGGTHKRQGGFTPSTLYETTYYFTQTHRNVYPYWFEFNTYAKRRWIGREIIDVLKTEYGNGGKGIDEADTEKYYAHAITTGAFRINGKMIALSYLVRDGDYFQHVQHRHETPVTAEPIRIHYETNEIVVIHKPSSIPIHPCGNYRHNSVLYMLAAEHARLQSLFVVHRLDAVTSGLVILSKTAASARKLSVQIAEKEVRKEYVARVQGRAPEWKDFVLSQPIYQYTQNGQTVLSTTKPDDSLLSPSAASSSSRPAAGTSQDEDDPRPGYYTAPEPTKESVTIFTFLSYDSSTNSSLIKCCPLTGRTHQIRLHLTHLGYPIANDLRYGGKDSSTGCVNDLAKVEKEQTIDTSSSSSSTASSAPFDAVAYWRDLDQRKERLRTEAPAERLQRIRTEGIDSTLSCPICKQMHDVNVVKTIEESKEDKENVLMTNIDPAAASSSSSSISIADLLDADNFSSPFSSTRIRVEYIWLHAFKYAYDPTFKKVHTEESKHGEITTEVASSSSSSTAASSSSSTSWSYEIPWPQWALDIATPELRKAHEQVLNDSGMDSTVVDLIPAVVLPPAAVVDPSSRVSSSHTIFREGLIH